MDLKLFVILVFAVAVVTVGALQWLKGVWKKIPSQVPAALLPILTLMLGWAVGPAVTSQRGLWLLLGGLAFAIGQLCYELIVQSVPRLVQSAIAKANTAAGVSGSQPPGPPVA